MIIQYDIGFSFHFVCTYLYSKIRVEGQKVIYDSILIRNLTQIVFWIELRHFSILSVIILRKQEKKLPTNCGKMDTFTAQQFLIKSKWPIAEPMIHPNRRIRTLFKNNKKEHVDVTHECTEYTLHMVSYFYITLNWLWSRYICIPIIKILYSIWKKKQLYKFFKVL